MCASISSPRRDSRTGKEWSTSVSKLGTLDPRVDVSVIIVSWNTSELLRACLDSLTRCNNGAKLEIIVVDNASVDNSAKMVARDFPHVRLLVNDGNVGFAAATNRGLAQAHGRYLLMLNSDTVVPPGSLDSMVRFMDGHLPVGAMGPRLLNADRSLQSSCRDFPRLSYDAMAILEVDRWPVIGTAANRCARAKSLYWSDHQRSRPVDWLSGACMMLRRDALDLIGLLDEDYFFFAEEMDLCFRLWQHGWAVYFFAGTDVVHIGGQSSAKVPAARLVWHYKGLQRFYRLYRGPAQRCGLRVVIAGAMLGRLASLLLRHRASPDARLLLNAYARVLRQVVA